jgi:YHS domain-containing protein
VIRLLIWLVLASLVLRGLLRLLRGIAEGLQGPPAPTLPQAVPLVRDPVCGMFVVPSTALSAGTGAQTKYFCSENCRRAHAMTVAQ